MSLRAACHQRFSAKRKWLVLPIAMILLLSCFGEQSFAAAVKGPLKVDGTTSRFNLRGHLELYQDKIGTESFSRVQSQKFSATDKAVPNFAFTRSAYWIKLAVENTTSKAQTLLLGVANPYLDFIDLFIKSDRNPTLDRYSAGACRPMDKKLVRGREPVLKLVSEPGEMKTIFLRVKSGTSLRVPLVLSTEERYHNDELKRYMLLGLFYGILGFLIIYNIFGWSILKQRAYFYYIWLLIGLGLCQLSYDGLIPEVTIFSRPELIQHLFNAGIGVTFVFNTLFVLSFMNSRAKYPILYRILDVSLVLAVLNVILFIAYYYAGNFLSLIYGPLLAWALAVVTGVMWYRGESHARYLFMGHVQFPAIAALHVGIQWGILPFNFMLAGYALKFGYLWQGMFLSLALADRYSIMQRNFRHVLENKVTERSAALVEANENLQREIAERKRAEKAIAKAKREWEETFDTVPDLIAIIDRNHTIQRLNKAMAAKLKLHPREAISRKCYEFCHGTDEPFPGCPLLQSYADGEEHSAEVNEPKLEGTFFVSVTPMKTNGFQPDRFVHVARDITERKNLEERLRKLATTDSLTDIWNRRHFDVLVRGELERAKRYGGDLALMMMDLDRLKEINDTYGHATGDHVLQTLAAVGRKILRKVDFFARLGGDEFAVALPETPLEQALKVAERLRRALSETPIASRSDPIYITVSIGVTVAEPGSADFNRLRQQADEALYKAKDKGRNRVEVFQRLT